MASRSKRQSLAYLLDVATSPVSRPEGNTAEPVLRIPGGSPQGVQFYSEVSPATSAAALATFIEPNLG